jgi:metal-sulfur cluster biosynthetic enzyme
MQAWATWVCNTFSLDEHRCAFKVSTRPGCRPQTNWLFLGRSASSFTFIAWLGRDKEIILFYFFVSLPHCRLFSRMVLLEVRGEIGPTTQHPHFELLRTSWVCRRCGWGLGAYGVQLAGPIARKCRKATGTLNSLENQIDIVFSLFWDAAFWRCGPVICTMDWWLELSWGIESIEFIYEFIAYPHRCNISHWREPGSEDCEYIEYTYITYIYMFIFIEVAQGRSAPGEKFLKTQVTSSDYRQKMKRIQRVGSVTVDFHWLRHWVEAWLNERKKGMNEWVDGWMVGWIDGWMDERMRWLNEWTTWREIIQWMNNESISERERESEAWMSEAKWIELTSVELSFRKLIMNEWA